jgi:quinoprotein glucose dehydrogenase
MKVRAWGQRMPLRRSTAVVAALVVGGLLMVRAREPQHQPYTQWRDYQGSADSMQYSALSQVNRDNVTRLRPAWFYPVGGDAVRLVFNPIVIDDVMYVRGAGGKVVALDAATGRERWVSSEQATERGITYWQSADGSDRRLILTTNSGLRQIDARTGTLITTFGSKGTVHLRTGTPRALGGPSKSPGRVFENLIIVGSITGEGYGSPPGDIRAYDVITGALVWTFHTVPRPGEYGYETWPPDAWKYAGGNNAWGDLTVDGKHGLVFVPTGSPTHDLYGADRAGNNLFGNSLIALDARTGKRRWHFQTVHHDLWDYDLAAAPKLLTVRHQGRSVDIVAQAGKTGFLYVFERLTGAPLWPIEERPVPRSTVPGEVSSPTQPFPTRPEPFARQVFTPADVNPFVSPEEQAKLRAQVLATEHAGLFTPSSHLRHHIQFPGAWGGANWGSTSADPSSGMLYVRSLEMPSYRRMSPADTVERPETAVSRSPVEQQGFQAYGQFCAACHGPGQMPMRSPDFLGRERFRQLVRAGQDQMPAFSRDVLPNDTLAALETFLTSDALEAADDERGEGDGPLKLPRNPARYSGPATRFAGSFSAGWYTTHGMPAVGPPWSQLVAYDLNEGVIAWRVPTGQAPGLAERGITDTGSVRPKNGPVVTAGGLVILANDQDRKIRAHDTRNGAVLWEYELEANPEGIPAVYQVNGRQFIAFSAGASWGSGSDPVWKNAFQRKQARIEAQGYHVFALPAR